MGAAVGAGLALLLLPWGMAPAEPSALADSIGCGDLAPFGNFCAECCISYRRSIMVSASLLGYAGDFLIELNGEEGSLRFSCWAVLVPSTPSTPAGGPMPLLGGCGEGVRVGDGLTSGEKVRLRCYAFPLGATNDAAPPAGPWGCEATLP